MRTWTPDPPSEREQTPRGPSLVVLTGRETVRGRTRRLDLRLLVPVVFTWPVVAFWGLLAPVWLVAMVALMALAVGVLAAVAGRSAGGWARRSAGRSAERSAGRSGRWARGTRGTAPLVGPAALRGVAVGCAVLALLLGAAAAHRAVRSAGPVGDLARERAVVTVRAVVAADPRAAGSGAGGAAKEGAAGPAVSVVRLEVSRLVGRGRTTQVSAPVLVIGRAASATCNRRPGQGRGPEHPARASPWPHGIVL